MHALRNAKPIESGGSVGYVPTRQAYAQGNYEAISAGVGKGSGERLAETAVKMLEKLAKPK